MALATAARQTGFDSLPARHVAAGHGLLKFDIVTDGAPKVQLAVHSDLYYLLCNSTVGTAWPMGTYALPPGYAGHALRDSDSWISPALLPHPERAKPIVMLRDRTMPPAREQAKPYGARGTMYPRAANPQSRAEQTLLITGTRDFTLSSVIQSQRLPSVAGVHAERHVWDGMGRSIFFDQKLGR